MGTTKKRKNAEVHIPEPINCAFGALMILEYKVKKAVCGLEEVSQQIFSLKRDIDQVNQYLEKVRTYKNL